MTETLERHQCVCVAAASAVAADEGLEADAVHILDIPECNPDAFDTVDLVVEVGGSVWTIEHTVVESYPNQLRDAERLKRMLDPILDSLKPELSPGTYWVVPPPEMAEDSTKDERERFSERLAQVLPQLAAEAVASTADHQPTWVSEPIHIEEWAVRFEYRRPLVGTHATRICVVRQVPHRMEERRLDRVRTALGSHLPKLHASQLLREYKSMLVLENRDPAMGTADLVMDAIDTVWSSWTWPDRVAFVEPWPLPVQTMLIYRDGQPCDIGSEAFVPHTPMEWCPELLDLDAFD